MRKLSFRGRLLGGGAALVAATLGAVLVSVPSSETRSNTPTQSQPAAVPVSVAVVEQRDVTLWDEFSGRLEAVERVDVRPRVAGAIKAVHFREGALVKEGDELITIDPEPYAAEVDRAKAQVLAAEARLAYAQKEQERAKRLQQANSGAISESNVDQRVGAYREAEGNLRAAQAALQTAQLNLDYTEVRAPVAGRVGKLEITVGNLIAAGPGSPVLKALGSNAHMQVDRIPVQMVTATSNGTSLQGHLQLIDNQVDAKSGTVRVRAVFGNADGSLIPGQFARLRMGQPKTEPALMVNERAIGTDQNKKYVMVVGDDNKAAYREVTLGEFVDGLRMVTNGLTAGEKIVVNGLQRVRPGAVLAPKLVSMTGSDQARAPSAA